MREILFRGKTYKTRTPVTLNDSEANKRIPQGMWVYGAFNPYFNDIEDDHADKYNVDKKTVGQFTGLCDKNGEEIFEADILEFNFEDIGKQRAVVYYNEKHAAFLLNVISENFQYAEMQDGVIVGNIHDNKELLEEI